MNSATNLFGHHRLVSKRPLSGYVEPTPNAHLDELLGRATTVASRVSSRLTVEPRKPGERPSQHVEESDAASLGEFSVPKTKYVHRILERNGGRVYQTDLVEAQDWSKSTVSRVLGEMEETGEIARLRVGRQKVVCYPRSIPEWIENDSQE